ncbi:YebC/PmpR family DNA-binding transcriptional regulator [Mesonia aestuariivivens]|uniref:Probable transcriptional regulatory protein KW502_07195 n=1 Tax=Mesonia aestuariivivens TaxID=2796128 RepID=A0ABS6W147_9FLAO|nr:YebC/PmpR family DNA-binding transcriptional regulator [Mesonia aestuariivivens]MBW2961581.1 YebC/PmpR family DNA-binding transcriptional regulator [Mesonia aestuariivivens]
MAGHSKWANIKHRKGAQDKKRAKQFTRAIKDITIAVKEGGGSDAETNPSLRNAIANAKGVNMPKDTIERAIKKASGDDADNYETVTFEGYGPCGIAIFVECKTDNSNRTVAAVRSIFSKNGGSLGTNGSLEFLFDKKGVFTIERGKFKIPLEELELQLIEGGAEDFEESDNYVTIYTNFTNYGKMGENLENLNIQVKNSEIQRVPTSTNELELDEAKKIMNLIDKFEDDDDVQNVFHTLAMTDELADALDEKD